MRIEPISVEAFTVHDAPAVDPVTVILRDLGEGKGRLIIECYCEAWVGYWGAMGERNLTKFLLDCDADYIANRIYPGGLSRGTRRYEYLVRIVRAMQAALKQRAATETSLTQHKFEQWDNGKCRCGAPLESAIHVDEGEGLDF